MALWEAPLRLWLPLPCLALAEEGRRRRFTSRNNRHKVKAIFVKFHPEIFVKFHPEIFVKSPENRNSHNLKRNVNTLETEYLEEKKTRNFRNVHQLHDLKPPISE